jgi:hypothetical protein
MHPRTHLRMQRRLIPTPGRPLPADMPAHAAVATARQAGLLGLPAIAACLATPSTSAPLAPAVAATALLVERAAACLQAHGGWPAAANFPRAHFPFPTRGRWALGRDMRVPASLRDALRGGGSEGWASADCWALGEEAAWQGSGGGGSGGSGAAAGVPGAEGFASEGEALATLQRAFCEGDLMVCLNVPPSWRAGAGAFAATRPGVLWHCYQVDSSAAAGSAAGSSASGGGWPAGEASSPADSWSAAAPSHTPAAAAAAASPSRSWDVSSTDLYGRTLPSQGYGSQQPQSGAFVAQDNTSKVLGSLAGGQASARSGVPRRFRIEPGTLLNDAAVAGDVEAVMAGAAAVTALPTWPTGHPFCLTDALLVHSLAERDGLPAWLAA